MKMFAKKKGGANVSANGNANGGLKGGVSGEDPKTALQEAAARMAASKKPPELKLPPQNRPDMSALDFLDLQEEEAQKRDHEIAKRVGEWMADESLPNLDKIEDKVAKFGQKVLKLVAGKSETGKPITFEQQREDYIQRNAEYLDAAFPIGESATGEPFLLPALETRRAAHMAVLKHRFRAEMGREQFLEIVRTCEDDGYFVKDQEGLIRVWHERYSLSDSEKFGGLGEDEERLLGEIVGNHVSRLTSLYKGDVQKKAEELQKLSQIEFKQLLAGTPGRCFFHVPVTMRGSYKLSEVYLLVEGGDGKISILDAVGPDKDYALGIRDAKIHLNLQHLEIPHPPRIETMTEKWGFSTDNAERYQCIWGYLDRARRVLLDKERRAQEKELITKAEQESKAILQKAYDEAPALKDEYAHEADISLDRVLMEMEPMEGVFFAEFAKDWKNPKGNVPQGLLYFLGEQKVVDGKPMMRVKKAPSHLVGRFFSDANMEFAAYGEFFEGLSQPMQGLMKALHRQAKSQAEVA